MQEEREREKSRRKDGEKKDGKDGKVSCADDGPGLKMLS